LQKVSKFRKKKFWQEIQNFIGKLKLIRKFIFLTENSIFWRDIWFVGGKLKFFEKIKIVASFPPRMLTSFPNG
jgi:hypothetical protein